jgi:NurA-like 5'-3' nuclease
LSDAAVMVLSGQHPRVFGSDLLLSLTGCETVCPGDNLRGREMVKQDAEYDFDRYRKLLAEAVDETKRLELIDIVIKEGARDKLEAQRTSDRLAMTAATVARVLGPFGTAR